MTLSRQASYDTFVFEKSPEILSPDMIQLLGEVSGLRKELDINGISEGARKVWSNLKQFQSPSSCFGNAVTPAIVNKIADRVDECSDAITTALGAAQMGRAFADNMAALCDALTAYVPGDEAALIASSIGIADKGYGRSMQAHGQLICVRTGLSEVANKIPSQVIQVARELKSQNPNPGFFNGIGHVIISVQQPSAPTDEDDVSDTYASGSPIDHGCSQQYNFGPVYMTFQAIMDNLNTIVADLAPFIDRINRVALWFAKMKRSLEALASNPSARPALTQDSAECWRGISDQFSLLIYKTGPMVSGWNARAMRIPAHDPHGWAMGVPGGLYPAVGMPYIPSPYMHPPAIPYSPPRRNIRRVHSIDSLEPPIITIPAAEISKVKKAALWRRILCMS